MVPDLSPSFHRALTTGYRYEVRCSVWRGGVRLPYAANIASGDVAYEGGTGTRATLTASLEPEAGLYDELAAPGAQLRVSWVMLHTDRAEEEVPLGRFDVREQQLTYGAGASVSLTAPDAWARVIDARLEAPLSVTRSTDPVALAARLVREAVGDLTGEVLAPTTARVWNLVFERDRAAAVTDLLAAAGMEGFIDRWGRFVVRPVPVVEGAAAWRVRASERGAMTGGSRSTSRQGFWNTVVVTPLASQSWKRFTLSDTAADSPTRVRPGLRVPAFLSDPSFKTHQMALIAARTKLAVGVSSAASVEVSGAPHPGLDPGDVVSASFPAGHGMARDAPRVLVAGHRLPLGPGAQSITAATPRDVGTIDEEATAA